MRIYSTNGTHPTMSASESSGRYHIYDERLGIVRKLSLKECYRLMTFPDTFKFSNTKGVAYKQIGNSVCVKVIEEIFKEIVTQDLLK
jgi:DNA (cytosine-5)-methyltransferase 1